MARLADHEGLASPLRHELSPRGPWLPRPGEVGELTDLMHLHVGRSLAEFASTRSQAMDQFRALAAGRDRGGLAVGEDRRLLPL